MRVLVIIGVLACVSTQTAFAQYQVYYGHVVTVCGPTGCKSVYFPVTNHAPVYSAPEVFATPGPIPNGYQQPYQRPYQPQLPWQQTANPVVQACGPYGCPPGVSQNGRINAYFGR